VNIKGSDRASLRQLVAYHLRNQALGTVVVVNLKCVTATAWQYFETFGTGEAFTGGYPWRDFNAR